MALCATNPVFESLDIGALMSGGYIFGEMPVLLPASHLTQSAADGPVSVTIINRELIKASVFAGIMVLLCMANKTTVRNHERAFASAVRNFLSAAAYADQ